MQRTGTVRSTLTHLPKGGVDLATGLWEVRCQVQRTDYSHTWRGTATNSAAAAAIAVDQAHRAWPGFSLAVTSVAQIA